MACLQKSTDKNVKKAVEKEVWWNIKKRYCFLPKREISTEIISKQRTDMYVKKYYEDRTREKILKGKGSIDFTLVNVIRLLMFPPAYFPDR